MELLPIETMLLYEQYRCPWKGRATKNVNYQGELLIFYLLCSLQPHFS